MSNVTTARSSGDEQEPIASEAATQISASNRLTGVMLTPGPPWVR
ncbi:hypothetical protein GCM10009539_60310 [Cryptosporangium japonicum]|uniref:Uncharacterized protein n=1 Tax=Cryptosporangium japonicum TaxID=80872 RepID=A0ABN0UY31_9ACTN